MSRGNRHTAVITGITGQDGSYLAELLLEKGYEVHGIVRRASMFNRSRIEHLRADAEVYGQRLFLHYADLTDATTLRRHLIKIRPTELYHLAGQSQPGLSFEIPESTVQETAVATLALLEILRDLETPPRVFMAASSEVFGSPGVYPQNEETPFRPVNPYGCAKAFAASLCRVYRESHHLHICCGIAYNHESPRRSESFVTRKITATVARIAQGSSEILELGNLDAERDWGWAPEYVDAMWRMLQHPTAGDYVLATGTSTSVRDFASAAFAAEGIRLEFEGEGEEQTARDSRNGALLLRVNKRFHRPVEPIRLMGNPASAASILGWQPSIKGAAVAEKMTQLERR
jgi:GDPmannose 4,6-dehydratase